MKSRIRFISRLLRAHDRRRSSSPVIPALGWTIFQINQQYRSNHFWQINRGNG